jgi:hypothetical protein
MLIENTPYPKANITFFYTHSRSVILIVITSIKLTLKLL